MEENRGGFEGKLREEKKIVMGNVIGCSWGD